MSRQLKFRGKRIDNGEWVYGYYALVNDSFYNNESVIIANITGGEINEVEVYKVIPETVGQYTGLKDVNGKEIYERDMVLDGRTKGYIEFLQQEMGYVVVWGYSDSRIGHRSRKSGYFQDKSLEVIGTIYD